MIPWNVCANFSPQFLAGYHDITLYDAFNKIKAFLLYPLNCDCAKPCSCESWRSKIVLSLNVHLYNKIANEGKSADTLLAIKSLLRIPEDHHFRELYNNAYPLWLIEENFKRREEENQFKMVYELVWTLLRLSKTYELSYFKERKASINEALEYLLGNKPLKTQAPRSVSYRGGEKAYAKRFNDYKSVCHFIAAFEYLKLSPFYLEEPDQIEKFLKSACWFRERLFPLKNPNVKDKVLFGEETLLSLPPWITSQGIDVPVEPFEEKLRQLQEVWENAPTHQCTSEYRREKFS